MADYTTQVKSICEFYAGRDSAGSFSDINNIISKARTHIFTEDYPIYAGGDKAALETKILKHYYMREIGFETAGLWKHFLNTRLAEIMPYYVDYMRQGINTFAPDMTIDLLRTYTESITDTGSMTETGSSTTSETLTHGQATTRTGSEIVSDDTTRTPNLVHRDKYSDTPQSGLSQVENDNYLTNYRYIKDDGTEEIENDRTLTYQNVKDQQSGQDVTSGSGSDTKSGTHEKELTKESSDRTTGISSVKDIFEIKAKILELIINVDMMIISDLSDLFMRIY